MIIDACKSVKRRFSNDSVVDKQTHKTTVLARGRIADLARHDGAHWQNYSATTTTLYCSVQPAWPGQQHLANDDDDSMPSSAVGMLRSRIHNNSVKGNTSL